MRRHLTQDRTVCDNVRLSRVNWSIINDAPVLALKDDNHPILNRCNVRKERTLVAQLDRFAINHVIADRSYSAENFSSNLRYFHLFTVNHLDAATRDDDVESDLIVTRKSINPLIGKPLYFIIINHRTQP